MKNTTFAIFAILFTFAFTTFSQAPASSLNNDNPFNETIKPIVKKINLEGKIVDGKYLVRSSFNGKLVTINPETKNTEKYVENVLAHTWVALNGDGYMYKPGFLIIMTTEDGDDIRTDNMYFAKVSENLTEKTDK